ncbi:anaphase-promoting complex subunit 4 [Onthophagus taurus]|uniref:anaphase-promoting complex subunit 4 n=1 Tax=Onthophagus taurus TaxID=166361 RepID=UPI000C20F6CE|nr:anaphase-promoting complex subunit 4 [Onthophagus taurus]
MCYYIKQLEERIVSCEIDLLSWSERMDLVAFSNIKGEVALHRLNWTRVWCLAPPKDGELVKALSWNPDGKLIAISYNSGLIILISIETKNIVNKLEVLGGINCMEWGSEKSGNNNVKITSKDNDQSGFMKYYDNSSTFLSDPEPLASSTSFGSNSSEVETIYTILNKQSQLNMLIIGTNDGCVYISIFGCFPLIKYDLREQLGFPCSVINIHISDDLNLLYATIINEFDVVQIIIIELGIFKSHSNETFSVCCKYEHINSIVNYLENAIIAIKETCETILLEMDSKLSNYASKVPPGTLSTDFLDVLVFGAVSDLMHQFLLEDLTKKGLEKFTQTIEMSYANIQKLLLKNVTKVAQNITYHLSELRGMARFKDRYEILGLNEDKITFAILKNGEFLTKSAEMQLVINSSMANHKIFFQWLYTVIMHVTDEPIPSEMSKMSLDDLAQISEFVLNFDNINGGNNSSNSTKTGFIMERIGQYLEDSDLKVPSGIESNEWNRFLDENECLRGLDTVLNHSKTNSLIQQYNLLKESINECFDDLKYSIVKRFVIKKIVEINAEINKDNLKNFKITSVSNGFDRVSLAYLPKNSSNQGFHFLELINTYKNNEIVEINEFNIYISSLMNHEIINLQFYTSNLLSLLLQESNQNRTGVITQISTSIIREKLNQSSLNKEIFWRNLETNPTLKATEGMIAADFAVSGSRKVSIVLSDNRRKVRIYEMEADEDDEEEAEITASSIKESDISMQEEENSD